MSETRVFLLESDSERRLALQVIAHAPSETTVEVRPTRRTDDQSRRFHAMVRDIARSGLTWAGKRRTEAEWKVLLVSGHAVAAGNPGEVITGLAGELISIRESTALMSVARGSSLIEYVFAYGDQNGVRWTDSKP